MSEIGNISGGGYPDWYSKTSSIGVDVANSTFTGSVVLDFGTLNIKSFTMAKATSTESNATVEIKCGNLTFATGALGCNNGSSTIRTVILSCANNPATTSEFTRASKLSKILGKPLNCTDFGTGNYRRFNGTSLTEFYLLPNKVTTGGGGINTGVLVDASLVSVANALSGTATGQTLTISNATTKAKCDTIMGTVSQVTENDVTYDFFTQDASGTVSLRSFITSTKGWTLA